MEIAIGIALVVGVVWFIVNRSKKKKAASGDGIRPGVRPPNREQ